MKFLLDENLPPSLAHKLKSIGYEARHVNSIGYNNTPDFKISEFAASTNEIILTHDTDFGTILALTGSQNPLSFYSVGKKYLLSPYFNFLKNIYPTLKMIYLKAV